MASLETVLAVLIVIACAAFSLWRLMSARLRLRLLDLRVLDSLRGGRAPQAGWRARLREKALAELSGGCGACSRAPRSLTAVSPPASRKPAAPPR